MLFIDDDILFTPEHVQKIYNSLKAGYDLIGGIYPVRGASQLSSYGWAGNVEVDNRVQEIEYLATGFMGVSRKLLEKMIKELALPMLNPNDWSRCWPFFECGRLRSEDRKKGGDSIYISEDWDFCQKAREIGTRIFADTSIQLGHLREEMFTPQHVQQNQANGHMQGNVYGPMRHQQALMQRVDEDLSEFLQLPYSEIHKKLATAQGELVRLWKEQPGSAKFYKDNPLYLFDLATFNQNPAYFESRLGQLLNVHGAKILDIGCGIGTVVFGLADQGNDVTGWEINKPCLDFCNFKKEKYNLKGEFTGKQPNYNDFDLIIAVDVLEHIKELKQFLFRLGTSMKLNARFYHSDFFPRGEVWPMHYEEHAEHLGKWLKNAGLVSWDERWAIKA